MTAAINPRSYWYDLAKSYSALGSPLKPCPEDIAAMEMPTFELAARNGHERVRALLLGVTPAIAEMRLPEGSSLLAVDTSVAMAQAVWPGDIPDRRWAVCGNWLDLPLRQGSCHLVFGDGSLNCLRYPGDFRSVAATISHVLSDHGVFVLRCYVRPDKREAPEDIFTEALSGRIPSFHHFKFRLLMAMQPSAGQGVAVKEVYDLWAKRNLERQLMNCHAGWMKKDVDTIQLYHDSYTVHTFPTMAEWREVLSEFFDEVSVSTPKYDTGDRCPTLVMRPRRIRCLAGPA
jgi:SAM-dependent methyltransferase